MLAGFLLAGLWVSLALAVLAREPEPDPVPLFGWLGAEGAAGALVAAARLGSVRPRSIDAADRATAAASRSPSPPSRWRSWSRRSSQFRSDAPLPDAPLRRAACPAGACLAAPEAALELELGLLLGHVVDGEVHARPVDHYPEDLGPRIGELLLGGEQFATTHALKVDDEQHPVSRRGDCRRIGNDRHRNGIDEYIVGVLTELVEQPPAGAPWR